VFSPHERSNNFWVSGSRYALAIVATLIALGATFALKRVLPAPSFLFFVPAVAISAWYGGRLPSLLATALSLLLIKYVFLAPVGSLRISHVADLLEVVAFLVVALTIIGTMEALRRARALAESHASELERLNGEIQRVADRATRLLDVASALSEAISVDEVTAVVLGKGLAVVEASRGVLISVEGERLRFLGARGMSPTLLAQLVNITFDSEIPVVHALRKGGMVSIESAEEFRQKYGALIPGFEELADMQTYLATPLVHAGETVGALALHFKVAAAVGAADRTFTLLLAQATATALHRARSYDAELDKRHRAEMLAQAREDVLGVVAHDLRNPLNLILMTTELLIDEELPPERRKEMLGIATRAAKQMNRLIDDLLDHVRLQAGKLSLDVEDVSVDTIMRQAEETFRPLAERRHLHFETAGQDGVAVRADPTRVSQIVGNLIGNAIKFTPEKGSVKLRATPDDKRVVFQIADDGPGISPDNMAHLFDNFWQARKSDRRGVGLGLAIVKELVEAHGGKIWVESKVDHGSTFSFSLPAVSTAVESVDTL
jgi:signal transduction histidine kinase